MHWSIRWIAAAFAIFSVALSVLSLSFERWYDYTVEGVETTIGVFHNCTGGSCVDVFPSYPTILSPCTRSGEEAAKFMYGLLAIVLAGGVASLLGLLAEVLPCPTRIAGSVLFLFATLCAGAMVLWSLYIWEGWYYCGEGYCAWNRSVNNVTSTTTCTDGMGRSWWFIVGATAASLVSFACSVPAACERAPPATSEPIRSMEAHPHSPDRAAADRIGVYQEEQQPLPPRVIVATPPPAVLQAGPLRTLPQGTATASSMASEPLVREVFMPAEPPAVVTAAPLVSEPQRPVRRYKAPQIPAAIRRAANGLINQLPEGEWEYDSVSSLYWSDTEQLFLHLESGMFYDPATEMWYNSEEERWFRAD